MKIREGVVGKIISGKDQGSFVKVIDDRKISGGFLILISQDPDLQKGFDCWVEDEESLEQFFSESEWVIDWTNAA